MFRYAFGCGLSKLLTGGKPWWDFTGVKMHLGSLPLPNYFSWVAYNLPEPLLRFISLDVLIVEILMACLFYSPFI